jgi:hypothetical protein
MTHVFEAVEILIPLTADIALKRLLLLHAHSAGVRSRRLRVDYRKGPITVFV